MTDIHYSINIISIQFKLHNQTKFINNGYWMNIFEKYYGITCIAKYLSPFLNTVGYLKTLLVNIWLFPSNPSRNSTLESTILWPHSAKDHNRRILTVCKTLSMFCKPACTWKKSTTVLAWRHRHGYQTLRPHCQTTADFLATSGLRI